MGEVQEITDVVQRSNNRDETYNFGRVTHTTLQHEDGRFFVQSLSDEDTKESEGKDMVRTYVSEETSARLVECINRAVEMVESEVHDDESYQVHWFDEREEHVFISVGYNFSIQDGGELFNEYVGDFIIDEGPHSDVSEDTVVSLEIRDSFTQMGLTDATCIYQTQKPHEVYANIDSLEEYAERRADDNDDLTVEEILQKDYYTTHFHPSDKEVLTRVCEDVLNRHAPEFTYPDVAEPMVQNLKIEPESYEASLSFYIPFEYLLEVSE